MATMDKKGSPKTGFAGRNAGDAYVNVSWGSAQEEEYLAWVSLPEVPSFTAQVEAILAAGNGLKFGTKDGSVFALLDSPSAREEGRPYLLSGWSDSPADALSVLTFKYGSILMGDLTHPTQPACRSPRR